MGMPPMQLLQACSQPYRKGGSFFKKGGVAYIYTYKFTYIVLAERGVLDDPPNPPWLRACPVRGIV